MKHRCIKDRLEDILFGFFFLYGAVVTILGVIPIEHPILAPVLLIVGGGMAIFGLYLLKGGVLDNKIYNNYDYKSDE